MTFNNTTQPNVFYPVANALASSNPFVIVFMARDPTSTDVQYPIQKLWLNTSSNAMWLLKNFTSSAGVLSADWILFNSSGTLLTLSDTANTKVSPDGSGNIQLVGTANQISIVSTSVSHLLTFSLTNGVSAAKFGVDTFTAPAVTATVVPTTAGLVTITGGQVAAGTTTNVIQTDSHAANAYTIEIQRSQAVAATTIGDNGVCHFDSASFTVDPNGFVQLAGASGLAINLQTGTSPIHPSANVLSFKGATVPAGTHPIQTDGTAANEMTIEVQFSQAIASSDQTKVGLAAFNSAQFTVDANGFVSSLGSAFNYTNVTHGLSPYTVQAADFYISCDTSGGSITLKFPDVPTAKRLWVIKDRLGDAATNNITLTTVTGADTFDGLTSYIMNSNFQAINLLANASNNYEVF